MRKKNPSPLLLGLIFLLASISSCARQAEAYPKAWIDYPADGAVLSPGAPIAVISHAFAPAGVAEVVLSVNGEGYRRDAPAEVGQTFVSLRQDWLPSEAGIYILQIQAYDMQGAAGNPALITVEIIASDEIPPTPPPPPTPTPVISVTPKTPTKTYTPHPPTPTFTPTPHPPTLPPEDTVPPPIPAPVVPASGLALSCRTAQTLAWMPVSDPGGIGGYYVKLEREVTSGDWQAVAGYGPLNDKQVNSSVQCGVRYRWSVRAEDGAGNFSDWSAFSYFSISLN